MKTRSEPRTRTSLPAVPKGIAAALEESVPFRGARYPVPSRAVVILSARGEVKAGKQ